MIVLAISFFISGCSGSSDTVKEVNLQPILESAFLAAKSNDKNSTIYYCTDTIADQVKIDVGALHIYADLTAGLLGYPFGEVKAINILDFNVLSSSGDAAVATARISVAFNWGGSGGSQTYHFKKINGSWKISGWDNEEKGFIPY